MERLLVIRAQPRHLLIHLQLDRRPALRVLTQTRPRTLLHLPSRAANEPSRSLKFHNHRECPYQGLLLVEYAFTLKTPLRHYVLKNTLRIFSVAVKLQSSRRFVFSSTSQRWQIGNMEHQKANILGLSQHQHCCSTTRHFKPWPLHSAW